ncbi:MAG TPA: sigma-70 family RNA polymerase sigma factor [Lachnospiraceae bacterium]|nr:sigma-70 family RNA polymerase sigma factor [Lachnospiraceae bacterium]
MLSIEDVYREHSRTVFRYLLSLTRDEGLSEELTQETFYQAIKSAERFDGSSKVSTWLCAIARNLLLSERRKHPVSDELVESSAVSPSSEDEVLAKIGQVDLLRKLHLLDSDMREILYLRLLGNLSFREIGDILGRTENWARVTYYRGKEKLKKELESDE